MTPRADKQRCGVTGKVIFASKADARAVAALPGYRATRYHRCAFCMAWHLTKGTHNHGSGSSWSSA